MDAKLQQINANLKQAQDTLTVKNQIAEYDKFTKANKNVDMEAYLQSINGAADPPEEGGNFSGGNKTVNASRKYLRRKRSTKRKTLRRKKNKRRVHVRS
jgi:hypothetical protein